jgi:hypothetical protein
VKTTGSRLVRREFAHPLNRIYRKPLFWSVRAVGAPPTSLQRTLLFDVLLDHRQNREGIASHLMTYPNYDAELPVPEACERHCQISLRPLRAVLHAVPENRFLLDSRF